jgi:hypothetical protein
MLWDSKAAAHVLATFEQAKHNAERDRKMDAERRLDVLDDDWDDLLWEYIDRLYESTDLKKAIAPHVSTEHNVLRRIGQELSQVYKWGVTRELDSAREQDKARILWEETELDETLETANLYLNVLRDLIIMPWVTDDGRMTIELLTPDRVSVVTKPWQPTEPMAFWFDRMAAVDTPPGVLTKWLGQNPARWERILVDHTHYRIFDESFNIKAQIEHGIGRLPAVVAHADKRTRSFWSPTRFGDVVKANFKVGWLLTMVAYLQKMQAEKVLTYRGDPDDIAHGQQVGAQEMLAGRGEFSTVDLQADPEHYLKHIRECVNLIAQNYGLSAETYSLSGSVNSGFQFKLQRLPLLEQRRAQIKKWRRIEHELHRVMALVSQRFHPLVKLDPEAELSLNFNEAEFMESPEIQDRVDTADIKARRASHLDILMRRDPDLTRKQAEAKQKRILEEQALVVGWAKELNAPSDPFDDQGKTPQENGRDGARIKAAQKTDQPPPDQADEGPDEAAAQ